MENEAKTTTAVKVRKKSKNLTNLCKQSSEKQRAALWHTLQLWMDPFQTWSDLSLPWFWVPSPVSGPGQRLSRNRLVIGPAEAVFCLSVWELSHSWINTFMVVVWTGGRWGERRGSFGAWLMDCPWKSCTHTQLDQTHLIFKTACV